MFDAAFWRLALCCSVSLLAGCSEGTAASTGAGGDGISSSSGGGDPGGSGAGDPAVGGDPGSTSSVGPLVAAYAFDDGNGTTAVDSSPVDNPGTVVGATWTTSGKFGGALSFNGSSDYVEAAAVDAITPATDATFSAWVYLSSSPSEIVSVINRWDQSTNDEYLFGLDASRHVYFAWHTTGGDTWGTTSYADHVSTGTLATGTWTHIGVVRQGTDLTFYIDGSPETISAAVDMAPFYNGTNTLRIGGQGRGARQRFFPGTLDEVRIYNVALTQSQIQTDMSTGIAGGSPTAAALVVSGGQPSGILASGTTQTLLSVTTDQNATCRFDQSDTSYAGMANTFTTTGGTTHSDTMTGLTDGSSYTVYVRCENAAGNANTTSYVISFSVASPAGSLPGMVDDGASHPPPYTGTYAYNSFVPPLTPGASYVDPVFGGTVIRLTTDGQSDNIYARNMWWNADATRYLHSGTIVDVPSGTVEYTGVPNGYFSYDAGFDPTDPNVLYIVEQSGIHQLTLNSGGTWTDTVYFTPPAGMQMKSLGGTLDWIDASGRYMVVRYGPEPSVYVYDRSNLAAGPYSGAVDGSTTVDRGSYVSITPDGKYLVGYDNTDWVAANGTQYGLGAGVSWPLDHSNRQVGAATHFWNLCGDHGAFISPSDGQDYMVVGSCIDYPGLYRVDITWNAYGKTEAEQMAHNQLLLNMGWGLSSHVTTVARGALRDWAFISSENGNDTFDSTLSPWPAYGSEIIAINVLTGEIRRLAHHRSRSVGTYSYMPRVSCSWGGEYVGFASNFNQPDVVNIYAIPFGAAQ